MYYSFLVDVMLGNRNGLSKDNTQIDKDGNPVKLSVSGSLGFRASGKEKSEFNENVDELITMRDYSINSDAAKALSKMSDDDFKLAMDKFAKKTSNEIDKNIKEIFKNYPTDKINDKSLEAVILSRRYNIYNNANKIILDNKIKKRGLENIENHPELSNIKGGYDKNFNIDSESVTAITDEQWNKLLERDLFRAKPSLKNFSLLDYKYLAQMTDEEHERALKRGLYRHMDIDESYSDGIGGFDILELSKFDDSQWRRVEMRDLLHAHTKYGKGEFWVSENVRALANLDASDWSTLINSNFLYSCAKAGELREFLDFANSDKAKELVPSLEERTKMILKEQKGFSSTSKRALYGYQAAQVLNLVSLDSQKWNKLMYLTDNFENVKMNYSSLISTCNFDDETWDVLDRREMLKNADNNYGLTDIAALSDEDWRNVHSRKINEMK